jgi:(R,R)-butanediol dehydrogenase/meso-butanediol dehydrogenase/diacetyl reductase
MKAAVVRPGGFPLEEVPRPQAGAGEVVVAVEYCGICGSDVHRSAAGRFPEGAIVGHEAIGTVAETGEGVDGWRAGDRVVVIAYDPCLQCRWCLEGEYQLCLDKYWIGLGANPGGFAEYVKARSTMLLAIPDGVSSLRAALTEPLAVALHAVRTAHINLGDTAVVIGAGPIGLLVLQCLQVAGARAVAVVEPAASRAELAGKLRADLVLAPGGEEVAAEVADALGAEPDVVFDCAGVPQSLQSAADLVRPHGRIMLVGVSMKPVPIVPIVWGLKEAAMQACIAYRDEFPLAMDLLAKGKVDVESLVTGVVGLDEVGQTIGRLQRPGDEVKVLVEPGRIGA